MIANRGGSPTGGGGSGKSSAPPTPRAPKAPKASAPAPSAKDKQASTQTAPAAPPKPKAVATQPVTPADTRPPTVQPAPSRKIEQDRKETRARGADYATPASPQQLPIATQNAEPKTTQQNGQQNSGPNSSDKKSEQKDRSREEIEKTAAERRANRKIPKEHLPTAEQRQRAINATADLPKEERGKARKVYAQQAIKHNAAQSQQQPSQQAQSQDKRIADAEAALKNLAAKNQSAAAQAQAPAGNGGSGKLARSPQPADKAKQTPSSGNHTIVKERPAMLAAAQLAPQPTAQPTAQPKPRRQQGTVSGSLDAKQKERIKQDAEKIPPENRTAYIRGQVAAQHHENKEYRARPHRPRTSKTFDWPSPNQRKAIKEQTAKEAEEAAKLGIGPKGYTRAQYRNRIDEQRAHNRYGDQTKAADIRHQREAKIATETNRRNILAGNPQRVRGPGAAPAPTNAGARHPNRGIGSNNSASAAPSSPTPAAPDAAANVGPSQTAQSDASRATSWTPKTPEYSKAQGHWPTEEKKAEIRDHLAQQQRKKYPNGAPDPQTDKDERKARRDYYRAAINSERNANRAKQPTPRHVQWASDAERVKNKTRQDAPRNEFAPSAPPKPNRSQPLGTRIKHRVKTALTPDFVSNAQIEAANPKKASSVAASVLKRSLKAINPISPNRKRTRISKSKTREKHTILSPATPIKGRELAHTRVRDDDLRHAARTHRENYGESPRWHRIFNPQVFFSPRADHQARPMHYTPTTAKPRFNRTYIPQDEAMPQAPTDQPYIQGQNDLRPAQGHPYYHQQAEQRANASVLAGQHQRPADPLDQGDSLNNMWQPAGTAAQQGGGHAHAGGSGTPVCHFVRPQTFDPNLTTHRIGKNKHDCLDPNCNVCSQAANACKPADASGQTWDGKSGVDNEVGAERPDVWQPNDDHRLFPQISATQAGRLYEVQQNQQAAQQVSP